MSFTWFIWNVAFIIIIIILDLRIGKYLQSRNTLRNTTANKLLTLFEKHGCLYDNMYTQVKSYGSRVEYFIYSQSSSFFITKSLSTCAFQILIWSRHFYYSLKRYKHYQYFWNLFYVINHTIKSCMHMCYSPYILRLEI